MQERADRCATTSGSSVPGAPDAEALRQLAETARPPCVSLYLPLDPLTSAGSNAVRACQAGETAAKRLEELAPAPGTVRRMTALLAAVKRAVEAQPRPGGSLVALLDAARLRLAPLASRLPARVAVGGTFVLRPLLRSLAGDSRYRLLAASDRGLVLYEGDARGISEVPCDGIPSRSGLPTGRGPAAREGDPTQGHSGPERAVLRRFQHDCAPLVLAADVKQQSGLRGVLRVPGLLEEGIVAPPDGLSATALHDRAWPLVAAALKRRERAVLERWERARNRRRSADRADEIARALVTDRVRTLFVEEDASLPGRVDRASGALRDPVGDDDVMEHLVALALSRGAGIHVMADGELPVASGVAAELV